MKFQHLTCRTAVSLSLLAGPLAACAPGQSISTSFSTQTSRIGPDDGTDSCRQYVVALDSTGNFFAGDIIKGAAVGALGGGLIGGLATGNWRGALIGAGAGAVTGAAVGYWNALQQQHYDQAVLYTHVQGDISADNAQITQTQYAFDRLMGCRFQQAAAINAAYHAHAVDRATAEGQMQSVRALAQRDLGLARTIDMQIEQRGQQFNVAADNVAPGTSARLASDAAAPAYKAVVARTTTLRTSPNAGAPTIATLPAHAAVQVQRKRGDYALVQADTGETGYAATDDLRTPGTKRSSRSLASKSPSTDTSPGAASASPAPDATAGQQDVATLAGSNAARRDDFAQSVAVSEKAVASGFEVAG